MTALIKFAEELKKKREALEISLNDIYEKTRIDKKYLEEMEKGNYEIMPDVYMRAFIRKYADSINCNVEETILRYEAARKGKNFNEIEISESDKNSNIDELENKEADDFEERSQHNGKKTRNFNPLIVIVFALVIIILGILYFIVQSSNNSEILVETKVEDIIEQQNSGKQTSRFEVKTDELNPNSSLDVNKTKKDRLALKINAIDSSWFRIQIDKNEKDEFILAPSRSKTLFANSQIDLLIGNSGGIEFILNGKKLEFKGKKGEIKNVIVDSQGIHFSGTN